MFLLQCGDTMPHPAHQHVKHWEKAQLRPHLAQDYAFPDEWDVTYQCPGLETDPVKKTQWFAYWRGVQDSVQHWANGTPLRCPYDTPTQAQETHQ